MRHAWIVWRDRYKSGKDSTICIFRVYERLLGKIAGHLAESYVKLKTRKERNQPFALVKLTFTFWARQGMDSGSANIRHNTKRGEVRARGTYHVAR